MKKVFRLSILFSILTSILFVSCDNFLDGKSLKDEIDDEVTWSRVTDPLKVEYCSPSYNSSGVFKDSIIEIHFNKSINPQTLKITLKDGNEKLNDFYLAPELFSNNKIVKIRPNPENRIQIYEGGIKDVSVTISKSLKALDGSSFAREDYVFTFRLNSITDKDSPVVVEMKLCKKNFDNNVVDLTLKEFDEWEEQDFYTNYVNGYFVKIKARDAGSGASGILVTEQFLEDNSGNKMAYERKRTSIHKLDFKNDVNDPSLYYVEGDVGFSFEDDGVIKLSVQVVDANENASEETLVCYVIKNTKFELNRRYKEGTYTNPALFNYGIECDEEGMCDFSSVENQEYQQVRFEGYIDGTFYRDMSIDVGRYEVKFETGTSLENMTYSTKDVTYTQDEKTGYYGWNANVRLSDLNCNNFVKVTVYEESGNQWSMNTVIPVRTELRSGTRITSASDSIPFSESFYYGEFDVYYLEKGDGVNPDKDLYTKVKSYPQYFSVPEGKTYYVYYQAYYTVGIIGSYIYAPLSKRYEISGDQYSDDFGEDFEIPDYEYEYNINSNNEIEITIKEDSKINYFDCFGVNLMTSSYSHERTAVKKGDSFVFVESLSRFRAGTEVNVIIRGYRSGFAVYGSEKNFTITIQDSEVESEYGSIIEDDEIKISKGSFGVKVDSFPSKYKDIAIKDPDSSEDSYKVRIYYQLDNTIKLEKLDKTDYFETTTKDGIPSYFLDEAYYHLRVELLNTSEKRIVSEDLAMAIFYNADVVPKISTQMDIRYVDGAGYEKEGSLVKTRTAATDYKEDLGLCYYTGSNAKEWWTLGKNSNYYRPFEVIFNNKSNNDAVVYHYKNFVPRTNRFYEAEKRWVGEQFIPAREGVSWNNVWQISVGHYVVNDGYTSAMQDVFWDGEFVKLYMDIVYGNDSKAITITAPRYYYLDGLAKAAEYPEGPKVKNLIDGGYMLTLLCDAPAYVHTVYADRDLGKLDYWEMRGISTGEQVVRESGNLEVDLSKIPDGMYYTTIVWFMDGTATMGSVHQKK